MAAYPDRLYAILERVCGLGSETTVLEVGPGTGQASRELLARGGGEPTSPISR